MARVTAVGGCDCGVLGDPCGQSGPLSPKGAEGRTTHHHPRVPPHRHLHLLMRHLLQGTKIIKKFLIEIKGSHVASFPIPKGESLVYCANVCIMTEGRMDPNWRRICRVLDPREPRPPKGDDLSGLGDNFLN